MSNQTIPTLEFPLRLHFIPEWAEAKKMNQTAVSKATGADKGMVSRWFSGVLPQDKWLVIIAAAFGTDYHGLFTHPDDQWLIKLFKGSSEADKRRAREMLALLFDKTKPSAD